MNMLSDPITERKLVEFTLDGVDFTAISAGPYFELNSAVSLMVTCHSAEEAIAFTQASVRVQPS